MAVPFRRTSKTRKRKRRTHQKLSYAGVNTCKNCGNVTQAHRACRYCGYFKDRVVVQRKETKIEKKRQENELFAK